MKLRAKIQRGNDSTGRWVRLTFPIDRQWPYWINENIIVRNIGPRPWGEGFMVNDKGEKVCIYWGRH